MYGIDKACKMIKRSENISVLTGAGMSVESGIAPFRGEEGLWEDFDPAKYAHIRSYKRNPERCWKLFRLQIEETFNATPHEGYEYLVELEDHGLKYVITQNIDGLHQKAGNENVIELHGTLSRLICESCENEYKTDEFIEEIEDDGIPECGCGNILRPDVVLFGEQLDSNTVDSAISAAQKSDLMLVVATSSIVQPAASLPGITKNSSGDVIEINLEKTPITDNVSDIFIEGKAGDVLPNIVESL